MNSRRYTVYGRLFTVDYRHGREGDSVKVITLSNQKGGVSKTTTAAALASGLSHRGFRVLAVDLDPQCNLSVGAGVDVLNVSGTLYSVFKGETDVEAAIYKSEIGYSVLPGGLALAGADMEFTHTGREFMLSEALERVSEAFDYCVIDTPPTLGILTTNALAASQAVIIPLTADAYALQGLTQLNGLIQNVRKYCNRGLTVAGLLLTRYSDRQNVSKAIRSQIEAKAAEIGTQVFKTTVRESVAVREAALLRADIFTEAPKANATLDYTAFIDEVMEVL